MKNLLERLGALSMASATAPCQITLPLAHDGDARTQLMRRRSRMCELKSTVLPRSCRSLDDALDLDAAHRVEPGHGLVEEHEFRVVDQRLRDTDALQHALGVLAQTGRSRLLEADVTLAYILHALTALAAASSENRSAQKPRNSRPDKIVVEVGVLGQVTELSERPSTPIETSPAVGRMTPTMTGRWWSCRRRWGPRRPNTSPVQHLEIDTLQDLDGASPKSRPLHRLAEASDAHGRLEPTGR